MELAQVALNKIVKMGRKEKHACGVLGGRPCYSEASSTITQIA